MFVPSLSWQMIICMQKVDSLLKTAPFSLTRPTNRSFLTASSTAAVQATDATFSASGIGSDASSSSGGGVSFFATAAASSSPFFFSSSGPRASACALTRASSAAEESAAFFAEGLREAPSSSLFQSFEVLLCLSRACLGNE